ncbi:MAG: hypothetical protein V7721_10895 [Porticoccaceae bacterium]
MNETFLYKSLLFSAFIFQLLIDVGGYFGWHYNLYPSEVFAYSGYAELISFRYSFALYLAWIAIFYLSLILMIVFSKITKPVIFVSLGLSFVNSFIGGVYIGTPYELAFSWLGWSAYIAACAMVFFAPAISARFKNV